MLFTEYLCEWQENVCSLIELYTQSQSERQAYMTLMRTCVNAASVETRDMQLTCIYDRNKLSTIIELYTRSPSANMSHAHNYISSVEAGRHLSRHWCWLIKELITWTESLTVLGHTTLRWLNAVNHAACIVRGTQSQLDNRSFQTAQPRLWNNHLSSLQHNTDVNKSKFVRPRPRPDLHDQEQDQTFCVTTA